MDIKQHSQKIFVFVINLLVVVLVVCGIKEAAKRFAVENQQTEAIQPVASDVSNAQAQIGTDRENKLRDLNNEPKAVMQNDQVTTTVSAPSQTTSSSSSTTKAPSRKTKTS